MPELQPATAQPPAEPAPEAVLEIRGLAAKIRGQEVLTDVNVRLRRAETLGLVGETGSGKTVTCRAVLGLLPRIGGSVAAGEIVFDGQEITTFGPRQWRQIRGRDIALVPQSSLSGLDPVRRIGAQLVETIRVLDPVAAVKPRSLELLELVEMPRPQDVLGCYPHELSGGMRQRAMIALALAGRPKVLIADEPTTALDVTVQAVILRLLDKLRREMTMSLILVTHDLAVVEAVSSVVAVMYAGMTVESGATEEVLTRPRHPYTRALLAARPTHRRPGERLQTVAGVPPAPTEWEPGCRFAPRCAFVAEQCRLARPALVTVAPAWSVACVRHEELDGE